MSRSVNGETHHQAKKFSGKGLRRNGIKRSLTDYPSLKGYKKVKKNISSKLNSLSYFDTELFRLLFISIVRSY